MTLRKTSHIVLIAMPHRLANQRHNQPVCWAEFVFLLLLLFYLIRTDCIYLRQNMNETMFSIKFNEPEADKKRAKGNVFHCLFENKSYIDLKRTATLSKWLTPSGCGD